MILNQKITTVTPQGRPSPNSHDTTLPGPSVPLLRSSSLPFNEGYNPRKNVGIKDAGRWILEHFERKINSFMHQAFWLCVVTFEFQASVPHGEKMKSWNTPFPLGYRSMPVL